MFFGNYAVADKLFSVIYIIPGCHLHIQPGLQSQSGRICSVCCHSVIDHLVNRIIIRNHESVETQLISENSLEEPSVTGSRYAVVIIERRHNRSGTSFQSCLIYRQITVTEHPFRHIYGIIFPSCLRCPVRCEMLHTGKDRCAVRKIIALITLNHCSRKSGCQIRILPGSFRHSSPTGICGYVAHRRERPRQSHSRSLDCSNPCGLSRRLDIPGTG